MVGTAVMVGKIVGTHTRKKYISKQTCKISQNVL